LVGRPFHHNNLSNEHIAKVGGKPLRVRFRVRKMSLFGP
jgi:hypothetical protein